MIKETIQYKDLDGNEKTLNAYFHLTMREMRKLLKDGIQEKFDAVSSGKASPDQMFDLIDEIIEAAYGERVEINGEAHFKKDPELTQAFMDSDAYDSLLSKLMEDGDVATKFFSGLIPEALSKRINAVQQNNVQPKLTPEAAQYLAQLNQSQNS